MAFRSLMRRFATAAPVAASAAKPQGALVRSAREVALRTCSTQLLLTRWALEANMRTGGEQDPAVLERARSGHAALQAVFERSAILEHMTPRERSLHERPFGSFDLAEDLFPLQSRWESFGILVWALRIIKDVPTPPQAFPHEQLYQATAIVPAFPNTIDTFIEYFTTGEGSKDDHVVAQNDFSALVDRTEAWYWRSRAQLVLELKQRLNGDSPEQKEARRKLPSGLSAVMDNIEKAIEQATQRALADGLISAAADGDFAVREGVAYRDLDDHGLRDLERMAEARLAALGWLAGTGDWEYQSGEVKFISTMGSLWAPKEA